jgi:hypothetical protein
LYTRFSQISLGSGLKSQIYSGILICPELKSPQLAESITHKPLTV